MMNLPIRAQVKGGRLVVDVPTDLPEGTVVPLRPDDQEILTLMEELLRASTRPELRAFVEERAWLWGYLYQACLQLRSLFGEAAPITLELDIETEEESNWSVFLRVHTKLSLEEATQQMEHFESWLFGLPEQVRSTLNADVAFLS
jgi:hypothetical protein